MASSHLVYAGHSAVFLHLKDKVIGIDPWLEGNPLCPNGLKNPEQLDLIVLTHGHADHASDAVRLAKSTGAAVAATFELACLLQKEGVPGDQLVFMNKGGTVTVRGVAVTLTHALHSSSFDTESGPVYAGEACGAVVRYAGQSIYHSGDTALFSDMKLIGETYKPTFACLCMGDCFTMGPREAAQAARLLQVKRAMPIHYATFPPLTGTAEEFASECKAFEISAEVAIPGGEVLLG